MRIKTTLLFTLSFIILTNNSFGQVLDYSDVYITGNNVNLRADPNLDSEVISKENWGSKYLGKKYDEKWFQLYSWDESGFFYISSEFVANYEEFIKKSLELSNPNSTTKLLILDNYIDQKNSEQAIELAIKLINKTPEETILIGFEHCELVSHSAFKKIQIFLADEVQVFNFKEEINNPSILNLIELAEIERLIKANNYAEALKSLNKILESKTDYLIINVTCEYDAESKYFPQFWFKNLYYINYHLMPDEVKGEVINYLRNSITSSESDKQRAITKDIYSKLSGIWNID